MQYNSDFSLRDLTEFLPKTITQIYGPPASGKTNLCLIAALKTLEKGKKVLFIDTEGSISVERLRQLTDRDVEEVLKEIVIAEPADFDEQKIAVNKVEEVVMKENIGLIIVDSFITFYRLEISKTDPYILNRELSKQLATLLKVSKKYRIPVLITNQAYAPFGDDEDKTKELRPIGKDLLRYWSKVIIVLDKNESGRTARLVRHKYKREGPKINFTITSNGLE